jgi:hypothetical protein
LAAGAGTSRRAWLQHYAFLMFSSRVIRGVSRQACLKRGGPRRQSLRAVLRAQLQTVVLLICPREFPRIARVHKSRRIVQRNRDLDGHRVGLQRRRRTTAALILIRVPPNGAGPVFAHEEHVLEEYDVSGSLLVRFVGCSVQEPCYRAGSPQRRRPVCVLLLSAGRGFSTSGRTAAAVRFSLCVGQNRPGENERTVPDKPAALNVEGHKGPALEEISNAVEILVFAALVARRPRCHSVQVFDSALECFAVSVLRRVLEELSEELLVSWQSLSSNNKKQRKNVSRGSQQKELGICFATETKPTSGPVRSAKTRA